MSTSENDIFQIAIDGTSVSGKGTVARMLARKFGFLCLDTGSLYRGITMHFMKNDIDLTDETSIKDALGKIKLDVKCQQGATLVFLDDEDVTDRLHDLEVCENVFKVASLAPVRTRVREIQHATAKDQTLICEGRDITSVVFPNARFKFYLTASHKARARRRLGLEAKKGNDKATLEQVCKMLRARDKADKTRKISPLKRVRGAKLVNSTRKDAYEVVKVMEAVITRKMKACIKKK